MIHHRSVDLDMKLPSRRAGIAAGKNKSTIGRTPTPPIRDRLAMMIGRCR
jgi:hypothetical protein